jgi:hypothetical protein
MFIPGTIEEITDLLNGLPEDVSRVLGMPEETRANADLEKKAHLSEEVAVRMNDFYLTIIAKKNALDDIPKFLIERLGVNDTASMRGFLGHFAERLSWYGDYFPDLSSVALIWGVNMPANEPLINKIRRALTTEAAARERQNSSGHVPFIPYEKIPIVPALGKYPRLGEQLLTKERIRTRSHPEPVRPSLSNWLRVYRDELGVGYHDPMLRGKFIFNSDNCKGLSSEERERLNLVLRSIEENVTVDIDPEKMEIVFPEFRTNNNETPVSRPLVQSSPVVSRPSNVGTKSYSEPHRPPEYTLASESAPVRTPANPTSGNGRFQTRPSVPTSPAPLPPVLPSPPPAPVRRPVSFAPAPPPNLPVGGSFSFSSPHSLPVESDHESDLSARASDSQSSYANQAPLHPVSPLPERASRPQAHPLSSESSRSTRASLSLPPENDMNPFHIHPVSARDEDDAENIQNAGRVVDLRTGE